MLAYLLALTPAVAPPVAVRVEAGPSLSAVAFSPDGRRLAAVTAAGVRVWDAHDGELLRRADADAVGAAHFRFGRSLTWVAGRALWSWEPGGKPGPLTRPLAKATADPVQATSPDGRLLARVGAGDRRLRLVSLTADAPERPLANLASAYGHRLTFSDDGRLVALANAADRSVTVFDAATAAQVRRLLPGEGERAAAPFVRFAPDGRSIAKADRETLVMETATGGLRFRLPRYGAVSAAAWSSDGRLVALGHADGRLVVADTFSGKVLLDREAGVADVTALAFGPGGRRLAAASAGGAVRLWPVPRAERIEARLPHAAAWRDLAESDAPGGFAAVRSLAAGGDESARWLAARLTPAPVPDPQRIAKLVRDLDDEEFDVREAAMSELTDAGPAAKEALQAGLKGAQSVEMRRRCAALLRKMTGFSVAPSELREARAVEAMEKVGTPAAYRAMRELLAAKPGPRLGEELRAALARGPGP